MSDLEKEKSVAADADAGRIPSERFTPADAESGDFSEISRMVSKSQSVPPPLPVDLSEMQTRIGPEMGSGLENNVHDVLTNREKYNLEHSGKVPVPAEAQPEQLQQQQSGEEQSETEVLRRNNRSIMDALNNEIHRADLLEEDVSMAKLEKDAVIDDYKLVITRLKAQIRTLVSERSLDEVYDVMEEDITRLTRELEMTRARNLALENKMLDKLITTKRGGDGVDESTSFLDLRSHAEEEGEFSFSHTQAPGQPGLSASFLSDTTGLSRKESKRLIAQVKHLNSTIESLKKEGEALKSTQRLHNISVRQTKDAARRVYLANQQADKARSEFDKERTDHHETSKCLTMVRGEVGALHDENRHLKLINDKLKLQVARLQREMAESEAKRKRERKMNNFVMKHVPGTGHRGIGAASRSFTKDDEDADDDLDASNLSFRKAIRKSQADSQQIRALQRHKLDEGAVNDVLTELRAEAVFRAPSLLNTIRTLIKVLNEEREIWRYMCAVVKETNLSPQKPKQPPTPRALTRKK